MARGYATRERQNEVLSEQWLLYKQTDEYWIAHASDPARGRNTVGYTGSESTVSNKKDWGEEETQRFKKMVDDDGPGMWTEKALRLGTGRSGGALNAKYYSFKDDHINPKHQGMDGGYWSTTSGKRVEKEEESAVMMIEDKRVNIVWQDEEIEHLFKLVKEHGQPAKGSRKATMKGCADATEQWEEFARLLGSERTGNAVSAYHAKLVHERAKTYKMCEVCKEAKAIFALRAEAVKRWCPKCTVTAAPTAIESRYFKKSREWSNEEMAAVIQAVGRTTDTTTWGDWGQIANALGICNRNSTSVEHKFRQVWKKKEDTEARLAQGLPPLPDSDDEEGGAAVEPDETENGGTVWSKEELDRLIELVPESQEHIDAFHKDKVEEAQKGKFRFAIASVSVHAAFDILDFVEHYFNTTDKPCLIVKEIHGRPGKARPASPLENFSSALVVHTAETGLWHVHGAWKEEIPDKKTRMSGWTNVIYEQFPHPLREGEGAKKTRPIRIAFPEKEVETTFFAMLARLTSVDPTQLPSWRKHSRFEVVHKLNISESQLQEWLSMEDVEAGGGAGKVLAAARTDPVKDRKPYHDPNGHSLGRTIEEWDEIANKLGTGRTGQAVRSKLHWLRKRGREEDEPDRQPWTDEESVKLEGMIQEAGPGEWGTKARLLGTGRSASCVALRYRKQKKGIVNSLITKIDSAAFAEKNEERRLKKKQEDLAYAAQRAVNEADVEHWRGADQARKAARQAAAAKQAAAAAAAEDEEEEQGQERAQAPQQQAAAAEIEFSDESAEQSDAGGGGSGGEADLAAGLTVVYTCTRCSRGFDTIRGLHNHKRACTDDAGGSPGTTSGDGDSGDEAKKRQKLTPNRQEEEPASAAAGGELPASHLWTPEEDQALREIVADPANENQPWAVRSLAFNALGGRQSTAASLRHHWNHLLKTDDEDSSSSAEAESEESAAEEEEEEEEDEEVQFTSWLPAEDAQLKRLVKAEGAGSWQNKANRFTTARSSGALRFRWYVLKELDDAAEVVAAKSKVVASKVKVAAVKEDETALDEEEGEGHSCKRCGRDFDTIRGLLNHKRVCTDEQQQVRQHCSHRF